MDKRAYRVGRSFSVANGGGLALGRGGLLGVTGAVVVGVLDLLGLAVGGVLGGDVVLVLGGHDSLRELGFFGVISCVEDEQDTATVTAQNKKKGFKKQSCVNEVNCDGADGVYEVTPRWRSVFGGFTVDIVPKMPLAF